MYKEAEGPLTELISSTPDGADALEAKYLLARSRLYLGDYLPAISGFEEIADKYKDSPLAQDALMGMAEAYERHNELYKAIAAYRRILQQYPDTDKKAEVYFNIGRNYLEHDNYALAVDGFSELLSKLPDSEFHERAYFGIAEAYYGSKDYSKAKDNYDTYLKKYPQGTLRDQALYGLAWSQMGLKEYKASYENFTKLVSEFRDTPLAPEAALESGEAMYSLEKYEDAARIYQFVIDRYPASESAKKAVYVLAWANLKLGRLDKAAAGFEGFSASNPKDPLAPEADYQRALIAVQAGDMDKGAALLKDLAEKRPNDEIGGRAKLQLAKVLTAKGNPAEAQALLDQLKKGQAPGVAQEAAFQAGVVKFNAGEYAEAGKTFKEFLAAYPESAYSVRAHYFIGLSALNLKDYAAGADELKKVVDAPARELPEAEYWLADTLYNLGRYDDALKRYDGFIATGTGNKLLPEAEYGRAWTYDKLGRASDAKEAFKGVAVKYSDGPHAPDAWYKVGEYSYKEKKYDEVEAAFEKYLSLKPSSALKADANYQLGVAREALGKDEAAISAFKAAADAGGPLKAPAALSAGKLLAKAGRTGEAEASFDAAAADGDYASEALVGKGKALLAEKKYDDALAALQKAPDHPAVLNVRAEGYYLAGQALLAKGDYKGAIVEFTKSTVLGESPFKAQSMIGIGECYAALGEKEKALGVYRKFLESYPASEKDQDVKTAIKKLEG